MLLLCGFCLAPLSSFCRQRCHYIQDGRQSQVSVQVASEGTASTAGRVAADTTQPACFSRLIFDEVSLHYCHHAASLGIAWKFGSQNFPNSNFSSSTERKWQFCLNLSHQLGIVAPFWNALMKTPLIRTTYASTCMLLIKKKSWVLL